MARAKWNSFPHLPAAQLADNDKIPVSDESQAPGDKDATTTIEALREAIGGVDHVSGPSAAAVGQLAVFADTTGKAITNGDPALTGDNVLRLVEAHASQTANPPGGITEQDIISLFRPDNPSDRSEGGKDYGSTAAALLAFIASNLSAVTLPQLAVTASLRGSSSNPNVTLTRDTLHTFLIGQLAYVSGRISWENLSGGGGALEIHVSDPSAAPSSAFDVLAVRAQGISIADVSSSGEALVATGGAGSFRLSVPRGQFSPVTVSVRDLRSSGDMLISGWYRR